MQLQEDNNYMGLLAQHAYGKSKKISGSNYLNQQIIDFTTEVISKEYPKEGSQTIVLFLKLY
mgnify:CR=1 FL=1